MIFPKKSFLMLEMSIKHDIFCYEKENDGGVFVEKENVEALYVL